MFAAAGTRGIAALGTKPLERMSIDSKTWRTHLACSVVRCGRLMRCSPMTKRTRYHPSSVSRSLQLSMRVCSRSERPSAECFWPRKLEWQRT